MEGLENTAHELLANWGLMVQTFDGDTRENHAGVSPPCRKINSSTYVPTNMTVNSAGLFTIIMMNVGHERKMGNPVHWNTYFMDKFKERCPQAWAEAIGYDWHNNGTQWQSNTVARAISTHSARMRSVLFWEAAPIMWCCDDDTTNHVGVMVRRFITDKGE